MRGGVGEGVYIGLLGDFIIFFLFVRLGDYFIIRKLS